MFGRKPKTDAPYERPRRRGQERSGASKQVFSYYNTGAKQGSDTAADWPAPLKPPHRLRQAPSIVAIAVIGISLLFSLTLSSRPSVETLSGQPSPYRPLDEYADAAAEIMREDIASSSKLTIKTSEVEDRLLERFPELNAAALRLPVLGRRPGLLLDIRPPALIMASGGKELVLDTAGTAISPPSSLPDETLQNIITVQDNSGPGLSIGQQVLPGDSIEFILLITAQLKAAGLQIDQLTLPASANQLDIRLQGLLYYLKTDIAGDARLQVGSFLAVRDQLAKQGIIPSEYIDLRVEEKVFYK